MEQIRFLRFLRKFFWVFRFGILFEILRILFGIHFGILMEFFSGILSGFNFSAGWVCGCAGVVGKEKFD